MPHEPIHLDRLNPLSTLARFGAGLARPECVACTAAGNIWVSHHAPDGGGVVQLTDSGPSHQVIARNGAPDDFMPNGWAMEPDSFLIANLADSGGVWRLRMDGSCEPFLTEIDGFPMPPVNFVHRDNRGRVWSSVSTWRVPRDRAFHRDVADGFIVLTADGQDRIVADGLGYTNEVKVDPRGEYLYAHETMSRRLSRYRIERNGLGPRETVVEYLDGVIPDGFDFDEDGGIWCASVMSNRLVRVAADGAQQILIEDCDAEEIAGGMHNWRTGTFTRDDMDIGSRHSLRNIASVTFGGPDRKTVYLGSLAGDSLITLRSPVAGAEPPHWRY
ncbi:MAG: SMP-30/gluconolactonase/LRE family protein [Pseudomonadota bacterium]